MRTPVFYAFRIGGVGKTIGLLLMTYRTAMVALALTIGPHAFAQSTPPTQAAPAPNVNGEQHLQVIFSPWTKYCTKAVTEQSSEVRAREVCFTAADGHLKSGQKLVVALLIEPAGSETKLLRVTLPLGVALVPGARIVIDEKEAIIAPYVACLPKNGCMADHKADADLIKKLKNGRSLAIQAFDKGKPISFTLPLTGFAQAHDGPASDATGLNELHENLPNEPQSRSENRLDAPAK